MVDEDDFAAGDDRLTTASDDFPDELAVAEAEANGGSGLLDASDDNLNLDDMLADAGINLDDGMLKEEEVLSEDKAAEPEIREAESEPGAAEAADEAFEETAAEDVRAEEPNAEEGAAEPFADAPATSRGQEHREENFVKWYSGSSADDFFEIDKTSPSSEMSGNENCYALHINVGYDTYGWRVEFGDGTVMNLRDVREYQLRNGCLPAADGVVIYGQNRTAFSGIERIVIYESVQYFSYGL